MFWGINLKPNHKYTHTPIRSLHVSAATLDHRSSQGALNQVFLTYKKVKYLLCTLQKGRCDQVMLDFNFDVVDELCFQVVGDGTITLSGYYVEGDINEDSLDEYMENAIMNGDEEEEDEEDDDDDEEDEVTEIQTKSDLRKILNKKKALNKKQVAQKVKISQKNIKEDEGDEDDDDNDMGMDTTNEIDHLEDEEDDEDDDDEEGEEDDEDDDDDGDEEADVDFENDSEDKGGDGNDTEENDNVKEPKTKRPKLDIKQKKEQNTVSTKAKDSAVVNQKGEKDKGKKHDDHKKHQNAQKEQVLSGGVKIVDLIVGNGPIAKQGKRYSVYYEGRLLSNNKVFDSTKSGQGFKFTLGRGEVIKGWDIGVVGMQVGGKRRITCPPHMAYGARGSPPSIPPNSTLVFEVELKGIA